MKVDPKIVCELWARMFNKGLGDVKVPDKWEQPHLCISFYKKDAYIIMGLVLCHH